tara:strand:- start:5326 stop:5472 length:147 start_codon:yes stop_codon:yes gene_type:complete
MKLVKIKCKQCGKKMTVYGNNRKMAIGIDIIAIQNKVDKVIPTCKHHN